MDKKLIIPAFSLVVLSLFAVLAVSIISPPNTPLQNEVQYGSEVCITTTGEYDGRTTSASEGINELIQCESNLVTDAGLEAIADALSGQATFGAFDYIALCNASTGGTGCGVPLAGDTTLDNEFVGSGLTRAQGAYGTLGTGNWSEFKVFTSTDNNVLTNSTGIFNWSTGGTLLAENTFTLVTLQASDTLTVNWTIMVTNP